MNENSTLEKPVYKSIIEEAFTHSAKAFSSFINKDVKIELVKINTGYDFDPNKDDNKSYHFVLVSELKGELKGKCYLKFSNDDALKLFLLTLPVQYINDEDMQSAILMELDNILTAAVVTVFSNKLNLNTYAYVPALVKIKDEQLLNLIENDYKEGQMIFDFYTKFKIEKTTITSEFIWVMDSDFSTFIFPSHNQL